MAELTSRDLAAKLLAERFERNGPIVEALSDPIADTPMTVTLDQLQAYDLNPRVTRNPRYDDIKSSIRERGLDAPPAITRRPGATHYIIRSGGNTRLAILHELWSETKDERFFRIPCLFRPWSERGEIIALTGHLAENELHGGLSFVERALGVEKARELYEESGQALTQTELARRLSADGYPITQPHISRMQDAVRYLLPAIPTVLYGGLGKPQVERLTALRKASARIWDARSVNKPLSIDFPSLFHDVLSLFDGNAESFSLKRVQDELIGQMADLLDADYDSLTLEICETENRQQVLSSESALYQPHPGSTSPLHADSKTSHASGPVPSPAESKRSSAPQEPPLQPLTYSALPPPPFQSQKTANADQPSDDGLNERLQGHIVSPVPTTNRLQSIQQLIADQVGDALPDFKTNALQAIPVQAGGLYPISDVWYIEPGLNAPDRLRTHIAQFAYEIAEEACQAGRIAPSDDGIGFICDTSTSANGTNSLSPTARAVLTLLYAFSTGYPPATTAPTALDNLCLTDVLGPLLQGRKNDDSAQIARLSDHGLVKLFRLLRLARRLLELEDGMESSSNLSTDL